MRPEDWRRGMENEAASVEDARWAGETRRAAQGWRLNPRRELRALLIWLVVFTALHVACLYAWKLNGSFESAWVSSWEDELAQAQIRERGMWISIAWLISIAVGGLILALRRHTFLTALGGFLLPPITLSVFVVLPGDVPSWEQALIGFQPLLYVSIGWGLGRLGLWFWGLRRA